ncbi:hypothetical protein DFJ74DRAFT_640853 [Hyaloraphidium curvatum]|nr:hypothetical protein DFJ74DRAFT_640853 [Hyaloraphidium curvatum]
MATFERPEEAASLLAQLPNLRDRVAELLELDGIKDEGMYVVEEDKETGELKAKAERPGKSAETIIDEILPKLWIVTGSYELQQKDGAGKSLFYIMDEVGSRLAPAPDPADAQFQMALVVDLRPDSDTVAFNVFWPVTDVGEGESCTARGLPNGRPKLNKMRSSLWDFEEDEEAPGGWKAAYGEQTRRLAKALEDCGYTAANMLSLLSLPATAVGFPAQNLSHPNGRAQAASVLAARSKELPLPGADKLLDAAKLVLLQSAVPRDRAKAVLGAETVDFILDQNMALELPDGSLQMLIQIVPLSVAGTTLYVAADFQHTAGGAVTGVFDPVMFIGVDSLGLAGLLAEGLAPRLAGKPTVDLCSGSGVQGLVAARLGATEVACVDVNPRAACFCRFNALLNALEDRAEALEGNLWDAVHGRRFPTVLANPPYIPNPEGAVPLELFGDGGPRGDELTERIVRGLKDHAEPGALVAVVGNIADPLEFGKRVEKWAPGGFSGKVAYGRAWTAAEYASLVCDGLPATDRRVQAYAEALRKAKVANVANGFLVGRVGEGAVEGVRVGDEIWQIVAGILRTGEGRAEAIKKIVD